MSGVMFNNSKEKAKVKSTPKESGHRNNHIEQGTKIVGDIHTEGSLRHDGEMIGNIFSKAKVVLGPTCKLEGNVQAVSAEISGEVKGTVEISEMLTIKSSGTVNGDIIANKMTIEPGGMFNGTSKMGAVVKNIGNTHDKRQQQAQRQPERAEKSA